MNLQLKRIYDFVSEKDGFRILVDRIWPRGVSKKSAQLDEWMKEVAPSSSLRKWFNHEPEKYEMFKKKYKMELDKEEKQQKIEEIRELAEQKRVTLLYAAKDETHNHVQVLKEVLEKGADKHER